MEIEYGGPSEIETNWKKYRSTDFSHPCWWVVMVVVEWRGIG